MSEENESGYNLIDRADDERSDIAKSAIDIDQPIMRRLVQQRMQRLGSDPAQVVRREQLKESVSGAEQTAVKLAGRESGKKIAAESSKRTAQKTAKRTVQKTTTEAAKTASKGIAAEIGKEGAALVASSSSEIAASATGAAAGTAGGPWGILIGLGVGHIIGQTTEAGFNAIDQHAKRNRSRREIMKSAMNHDKKMDLTESGSKRMLQEVFFTIRSQLIVGKLLLPGGLIAVIITLILVASEMMIMQTSTAGVLAIAQHLQHNREVIGHLAGGQDVVYYNQHDYREYPYGDSNISACGCGPTTMAMVVSTLTEDDISPPQVADYCMEQNLYVYGAGTSHALFYCYDMTTTDFGSDLIGALSVIPEGGMVILSVGMPDTIKEDGSHVMNGNEIYRGAGHIMAIRGVTEDGMILLADPNSRYNSETEWDYTKVAEILKRCWTVTYEHDDTVVRHEQL